jgi:integrase
MEGALHAIARRLGVCELRHASSVSREHDPAGFHSAGSAEAWLRRSHSAGTFRHSYRSWLDAVGTPVGVQQNLLRHASITTTMNVYGNAVLESKREANSKVVAMLRPTMRLRRVKGLLTSRSAPD